MVQATHDYTQVKKRQFRFLDNVCLWGMMELFFYAKRWKIPSAVPAQTPLHSEWEVSCEHLSLSTQNLYGFPSQDLLKALLPWVTWHKSFLLAQIESSNLYHAKLRTKIHLSLPYQKKDGQPGPLPSFLLIWHRLEMGGLPILSSFDIHRSNRQVVAWQIESSIGYDFTDFL